MCGIVAEARFDGSRPDIGAVARMAEALRSRGPDGGGSWERDWIALGHRRLSIIDLSDAAAQPMVDGDRGTAVVFNGCIYNYRQLRDELISAGARFRSTSDTEVVLHAYAHRGDDFVQRLSGMFAIVIADVPRGRLVVARDRLGIKPVYLAETPNRLRIASTLPGLLAAGDVDTSIDPVGLHHYLSWHSIVPAPTTLLRGVRKLPPATIRIVESDGTSRDRVYWRPTYTRDERRAGMTAGDWQRELEAALRTAVRRRLVADVPVGVLLSGGVDSSLVVALLADAGATDLSTFSIGFESVGREQGNEFVYSDMVAAKFGTDHHRIEVETRDLLPDLVDTIGAMTEPMGTHDVVAFYLLSREVSRHVKVVQSGQGADEVFGGYHFYQPLGTVARDRALECFVESFFDRDHEEIATMVEPEHLCPYDASRELAARSIGTAGADTALDAVLRLDTHTLLVDDPVKRVDSMSMAWGLEARVPFLDHEVVELAAACPPALKLAGGGKGVLKDIARRVLPTEVVDRPKGYFPVPAMKHLSGELLGLVVDALRAPAAKERALFRTEYVDALVSEPNGHYTRVGGNKLWQLGLLELWLQLHDID